MLHRGRLPDRLAPLANHRLGESTLSALHLTSELSSALKRPDCRITRACSFLPALPEVVCGLLYFMFSRELKD